MTDTHRRRSRVHAANARAVAGTLQATFRCAAILRSIVQPCRPNMNIIHLQEKHITSAAYWYASVKPLQYYCRCLPVSILLPTKKLLFWKKMLCSGNMVLCRLAKCCDASIFALAAKFHLEPHDFVRSSIACINYSFWFYFSKLV